MTKEIKPPTASSRPVDLKERIEDFSLPIANEAEARRLSLNPETAHRVGQAVGDLLSRLPNAYAGDEVASAASTIFGQQSRSPQTLPALQTQLPALPGCAPIRWRQVNQLPGYRLRPIRNMGNDIFMAFPCFRAFAEEAKARKFDAHGEVLTISDFTHDRTTVDHVAKLIAEKGVPLDAAQLDYGDYAPGYRPKIALFMTEAWTFKLVQDKIENGAPVDANFIYAWPGGAKFYRTQIAPAPASRSVGTSTEKKPGVIGGLLERLGLG